MSERDRIVALLREAMQASNSPSVVVWLSRLVHDIERDAVDRTLAYKRLDSALARTRNPVVVAAVREALQWLGDKRRAT